MLDEHGGIEGILTLHDLLQALVGELRPSRDEPPMLVERGDGSWLVDGLLSTVRLAEALGMAGGDDDTALDSYTAGGVVMEKLGRLPQTGDRVEWRGCGLEVLDMDGRRVDKLLVTRLPETDPRHAS